MNDSERNEAQALLTRAATLESQRQAACRAGDNPTQQSLEDEIRRLWQRYSDIKQSHAS